MRRKIVKGDLLRSFGKLVVVGGKWLTLGQHSCSATGLRKTRVEWCAWIADGVNCVNEEDWFAESLTLRVMCFCRFCVGLICKHRS